MLPLGTRNNVAIAPKPVHISKNPRVFEIDQCYIHHKARQMCGMKDVEVSVFDSMAVEVGGGIGFHL